MFAGILLLLLCAGFYCFLALGSKEATHIMITAVWIIMIVWGLGSIVYEVAR